MSFPRLQELIREDAEDLMSGIRTMLADVAPLLRKWDKNYADAKAAHKRLIDKLPQAEKREVKAAVESYVLSVIRNIKTSPPSVMQAFKNASISKEARTAFADSIRGIAAGIEAIASSFFDEAERFDYITQQQRQQMEARMKTGAPFRISPASDAFFQHNAQFFRDIFTVGEDALVADAAARQLLRGRLRGTPENQRKQAVLLTYEVLLYLRGVFMGAAREIEAAIQKPGRSTPAPEPNPPT